MTDPRVHPIVAGLLRRSSAYAHLAADRRERLLVDLCRITTLLAHPGVLDAPACSEVAEPYLGHLRSQVLSALPGRQPPGGFSAEASDRGVSAFQRLVGTVDFPAFVSSLVHGVFQAIVDSSIRQMEAYADLVESLAKSARQFGEENYSDTDVASYLGAQFPDRFSQSSDGLQVHGPLPASVRSQLGMSENSSDSADSVLEHAREKMGRQRQQLLATLVMMGINRIGVTDGKVSAKVVFDVKAKDTATHRDTRQSDIASDTRAAAHLGTWGASASTSTSVQTSVRSTADDRSAADLALQAQLSGDVEVRFHSESFPLERLAPSGRIDTIRAKALPEGDA